MREADAAAPRDARNFVRHTRKALRCVRLLLLHMIREITQSRHISLLFLLLATEIVGMCLMLLL